MPKQNNMFENRVGNRSTSIEWRNGSLLPRPPTTPTRYLLPAILLVGLTGCASPAMHFALENLGAETSNRTGSDIAYRTSISMHGLATSSGVGSLVNVPAGNLPDLLATPVSTGCSRIIEQNYEVDGFDPTGSSPGAKAQDALTSLANGLDTLLIASTKLAQAELQIALLGLGSRHLEAGRDDETNIQIATLLNLPMGYTQKTLQTRRDLLVAVREEAEKQVTNALAVINGAQSQNVLLLNWSEVEEGGLAAALGELFSSRANKKAQRGGYLLVAGLRVTTLQVGDDFAVWLKRERESGRTGSDTLFSKTFLVVQQLAARHLLFREEARIDRALAASLALNEAQLTAPISQLLQEQQLHATAALATSLRASSRGRIRRTDMKSWPYRFWGDTAQAAASHAELLRGKDFSTFYQVRADLATLAGKARAPSDDGVRCMHMVPQYSQGVRTYDAASQPTSGFCLPEGWKKGVPGSDAAQWKPDNKCCIDFTEQEPSPTGDHPPVILSTVAACHTVINEPEKMEENHAKAK